MKAPKLKRDWRGWRVRLLCEVSTRMATLPAGFEMTVVGTGVNTTLVGDPCACCGVQARLVLKGHQTHILDFTEAPGARAQDKETT